MLPNPAGAGVELAAGQQQRLNIARAAGDLLRGISRLHQSAQVYLRKPGTPHEIARSAARCGQPLQQSSRMSDRLIRTKGRLARTPHNGMTSNTAAGSYQVANESAVCREDERGLHFSNENVAWLQLAQERD
jgi:hypothetical protein